MSACGEAGGGLEGACDQDARVKGLLVARIARTSRDGAGFTRETGTKGGAVRL